MKRIGEMLLCGLLALGACGCRAGARGGRGLSGYAQATRLNAAGLKVLDHSPERAEQLFSEAVQADVGYGPAYNNLGVVLFRRKEYYKAAGQFDLAGKLMPRETDPLVNLGLMYEQLHRFEPAQKSYEKALERNSEDLEAIQCCARILVRRGLRSQKLKELLEKIVLRSSDESWRRWAQDQLQHQDSPATQPASSG